MAVDKLVDSVQLNSDLTLVANAIRTKGGTTASLAFPAGFVSAVQAIPTGGGGGDDATDAIIGRKISGTYRNSTAITIGTYAFAFCGSLRSVIFDACTTIGNSAFQSCGSLYTASFPECITINAYAFQNCRYLTSISFPKCSAIMQWAFVSCSYLKEALFPECIGVGYSAFSGCYDLKTATLPKCSVISSYAFYNCSSLSAVLVPAVQIVSGSAFYSCSMLSVISLPNCSFIANNAFNRCFRLVSVYLLGGLLCSLGGSNAFSSTPIRGYSSIAGQIGSVFVPASLLSNYQTAANWSFISSCLVGLTDEEIEALG